VWVPDPTHEAMRDLVRARRAAMEAVRRARQQLQGFLLRHGRIYEGGGHWTLAHRRWLASATISAADFSGPSIVMWASIGRITS